VRLLEIREGWRGPVVGVSKETQIVLAGPDFFAPSAGFFGVRILGIDPPNAAGTNNRLLVSDVVISPY
jgi:hypothetical protein